MKKIISLMFVVLLLFSLSVPCFASDTAAEIPDDVAQRDLTYTSVEYDFKNVLGFDLSKYPINNLSKTYISLIAMTENGYEKLFDENKLEDFSLFFYVYNPTRLTISKSSSNLVQIKSDLIGPKDNYAKYELNLISSYGATVDTGTETNGTILKFKVTGFNLKTDSKLEKREYEISGIELKTTSLNEYSITQKYVFRENNGSLAYQVIDTKALKFETKGHHSYYRYETGWYNVYKDVQSVYFKIPKEILAEYGELSALSAVWKECELYPCLVTSQDHIYNSYNSLVGVDVSEPGSTNHSFVWSNIDMGWFNFLYGSQAMGFANTGSYNQHEYDSYQGSKDKTFILGALFKDSDGWYAGDEIIDPKTFMEYLDNKGWSDNLFNKINLDNYVPNNPKRFELNSNLNGYHYSIDWWDSSNFWVDVNYDFKVFQAVSENDYTMTADDFAEKYKVHKNDVKKIQDFSDTNSVTYIFHYTITDYENFEDVIYFDGVDDWGDGFNGNRTNDDFAFRTTAIKEFDTISVEMTEGDVVTVFAINNSPSNFVAGVTAPNDNDDPDFWKKILEVLKIILIIFIVVVSIIGIMKLTPIVRNFIDSFRKERKK